MSERHTLLGTGGFSARREGRYYKFQGPFDLEKDLGGGVKIRLCNRIWADKAILEH